MIKMALAQIAARGRREMVSVVQADFDSAPAQKPI